MKTLVICLALIAGLLALPQGASAQIVVLHPGYPMVAPAPFVPYGFYAPPPYYPGYYPGLLGGVRAYGIGQYPPGYWGTDAVWRATEPHVHGYRWDD
jgi:hypothetical protein